MALALYPQYNRSKICHRLGLKGGQFKQRLDNFCPALTDTGFILASNNEARVTPESCPDVQLVIEGKERVLTFSVGTDALLQILPHIGALL